MKIGPNKVITVSYNLHSNLGDTAPTFVEETTEEQPLTFLFGSGQLIPDFELNLNEKEVGNTFQFSISAENAYGEVDPSALVNISQDVFKVDGVLDLEVLKIGNMVPLLDNEGNQLVAKVVSINDDVVLMDFNHPLAGHQLHFKGEVLSIREATPEELSHGHVHHDGMHDH